MNNNVNVPVLLRYNLHNDVKDIDVMNDDNDQDSDDGEHQPGLKYPSKFLG